VYTYVHSPCFHDNFKQQILPVASTWFPWNHFKQIPSVNLSNHTHGWTPTDGHPHRLHMGIPVQVVNYIHEMLFYVKAQVFAGNCSYSSVSVYIKCVWWNTVLSPHVNTPVYVWLQQPWQQTKGKQIAFVCVYVSLCVCGVCVCSPCKHTGLCVTTVAMTTNERKTNCICLCVSLCVCISVCVCDMCACWHEDALKLCTYILAI